MKLELSDIFAVETFANMGHMVDEAVPVRVTLMGGSPAYVYLWEGCLLKLSQALPRYKTQLVFGVDKAEWDEWVMKAKSTKGALDDYCGLDAVEIVNRIFQVAE